MLQPVVRRTWAPKGRTPVHYSWDRRDRLSVISAITVSPNRHRLGLYFDIHDHNVDTDTFEAFVRGLRRQLRRRIILVLDRWSVHRSGVRRLLERFGAKVQVEWLPAYAPDLNPVEQVWSHSKYADLANYIPDDVETLADEVIDSLDQLSKDQTTLRSFFHHARLRI
ncbi:MAG: transposase [Gemmatimonadales bacterium]